MKKILPIIMSIGFVAVGIIFAVSGISTIANKDKFDTQITATVVDIQEEWESAADPDEPDRLVSTAYIDYEVDGKRFEHVLSPEQSDEMKVGDTVDILVQSQNPEKISSLDPAKGGAIFIALGAVAALGGCISAIRAFIRRR